MGGDPILLGVPAIRLAQRDPVEADRAAHKDAVPDVPGVLALEGKEPRTPWPEEVGGLALVEHVLLKLLPVVVPAGQDLGHELIEVVPFPLRADA